MGPAMSEQRYITQHGAKRFAEELRQLTGTERPKVVEQVAEAAAQGDRSENAEYIYGKKRLREIDRRIHFLTKLLEEVIVVDPSAQSGEVAFFGAIVDVEETTEDGEVRQRTLQLVGSDEGMPDAGQVSIRSPIGKALLRKKPGDVVTVQRPAGEVEIEVISVRFPT